MQNTVERRELLEGCDADYAARDEPLRVAQSVRRLQEVEWAAESYEAQWRLSRAAFFLGSIAESPEEKRRWHQLGSASGGMSARLAPERVEGHLWRGINFGMLAQCLPALFAIPAVMAARGSLIRALKIDPENHDGAAYRVLGRIAHKSPKLLGGGFRASSTYFERALDIAPNNTVTLLYFAELLADAGKKEAARAHLNALLAAPDDPTWRFERERDRRLAQNLLKAL